MKLSDLVTKTKTEWDTVALHQEAGITPLTKYCDNGHEMYLDLGDAAVDDCGTPQRSMEMQN